MNKFYTIKEFFFKYSFYFFPLLIILGNAFINFFFISVVIFYFISCLIEKKFIFYETEEFKYFLIFYIYLLINSLLAEDLKTSILRSIPYLKFFIFVLIFKELIEKEKINLNNLGYIWFSIIFILSLDIIYQSVMGYDFFNYVSEYKTRNSGFFFDELVAGGFLVSFAPISIFLLLKRKQNLFVYFLFIFFLAIIFLSGERANLIDFIIISICVYFFCFKSNLFLKFFSVVLLCLILIFMLLNLDNFKNRYFSTISFSKSQNLNMVQTYFTSEYGSHSISSIFILKDNLLFGVGNKNFRTVCNKYKDEVIQFQKKIDKSQRDLYPHGCATHPHQIYYELLSEHGMIGGLIILVILFKLIFKNFSFKNKNNLNLVCFFYIILCFVPILPSGSFFSTLPSTFFWINYLFYIVNIRKYD